MNKLYYKFIIIADLDQETLQLGANIKFMQQKYEKDERQQAAC